MTILPKKKNTETKKTDQEFDNDNRHRSRTRLARERNRQVDEPAGGSSGSECSSTSNHTTFERNDVENRENNDGMMPRYKRFRQRSSNGSPYYSNDKRYSSRNSQAEDTDQTGYNSSDEHVAVPTAPNTEKKEIEFEKQLNEKKGYIIKQMAQDGACLFRSVADHVYGDQEMHGIVRRHCMDYMVKNSDHFSEYITEEFASYIRRKRNDTCHGNHVEMQAMSEMYNRRIEVYVYSFEPINTFYSPSCKSSDDPPIRVSYHGNTHYNSIIDPYNPSVGVGLGLAGYKPSQDNTRAIDSAIRQSEDVLLEKAMLQDKLMATDWEATDEAMAELVARESYLQWVRDTQKKTSQLSSTGGCSSTEGCSSSQSRQSPPRKESSSYSNHVPPSSSKSKKSRQPSRSPPSSMSTKESLHTSPHSNHVPPSSSKSKKSRQPSRSPPSSMSTKESLHTSPHRTANQSQHLSNELMSKSSWEGFATDEASGSSDWGDERLLAAVLARSSQEYYDDKNTTSPSRKNNSNS